jgi:hypothetical protein
VSVQFHVDKGGQLMGSASKLPCVVFRTALLAVLRSKKFHGETIGIMITASHNPAIVRPCLLWIVKALMSGQRCQDSRPQWRYARAIMGSPCDRSSQQPHF